MSRRRWKIYNSGVEIESKGLYSEIWKQEITDTKLKTLLEIRAKQVEENYIRILNIMHKVYFPLPGSPCKLRI